MTTKSAEAANGTAKRRKPAAKKQTPRRRTLAGGDRSPGGEVLG